MSYNIIIPGNGARVLQCFETYTRSFLLPGNHLKLEVKSITKMYYTYVVPKCVPDGLLAYM